MRRAPMPLGVPIALAARVAAGRFTIPEIGSQPSDFRFTIQWKDFSVPWGGSAHVKGAWTELSAALPYDLDGIYLDPEVLHSAGSATGILLDIGIGAAASEVVVVPNIPFGGATGSHPVAVPVFLPKGSRLAFRLQSNRNATWKIDPMAALRRTDGVRSPRKLESLGTDTATSGGTTIVAPGAPNTLGAWTQISTGPTQPLQALVINAGMPPGTTAQTGGWASVDFAIGSAGNEQVIAQDLTLRFDSNEDVLTGFGFRTIPMHVAPGTPISARYMAQNIATVVACAAIGVPYA